MKDKCDKIRTKLSAYLDGELSPDEMAEVAEHLESCPDCSALLEKMRQVDEMAGTALPDFDDKLMDSLAGRIMDGIDEPKPVADEDGPKPRAIPIWYRYVAVAATIVIVFLAGRMAFKESGGNLLMSPERYEMKGSAAEDTMMPYQESEGAGEETKKAVPQGTLPPQIKTHEAQQKPAPATAHKNAFENRGKQAPSENIEELPAPATIETPPPTETPAAGQKTQAVADMARKSLAEEPSSESESPGKIFGRVVDAKSGEPLFGVSVQLQGTTMGAKSNLDGDFTILSVPPDTYDLVYSSTGYESMEFTDVPVYPGGTEEMTVAMTQSVLETGRVTEVRGTRKSIDFLETGTATKTAGETAAAAAAEQNLAAEETLPDVDSLDTQYASLLSDYYTRESAQIKKSIASQKMSAASRPPANLLRRIIDSLNTSIAESKNPIERFEVSYLRLRAALDLYRDTGKPDNKRSLDGYEADFEQELSALEKLSYDPKKLDAYRRRIYQMKLQE